MDTKPIHGYHVSMRKAAYIPLCVLAILLLLQQHFPETVSSLMVWGITVATFGLTAWAMHDEYKLRCTSVTQGTVTEARQIIDRMGANYRVVVDYPDTTGKTFRHDFFWGRASWGFFSRMPPKEGMLVSVAYDPRDPQISRLLL